MANRPFSNIDPLPTNDEQPVDDGTGIETEDLSADVTITEPFDPRLIRIETKSLSIDSLLARIREDELDLQPGFQRKAGIWRDDAQSRLIESILIRIPLPAFYVDASDDDRWLVVDGLQRLTALKRFIIDHTLRLTGLDYLADLHGSTFTALPRSLQRRINETQVIVYVIEPSTPPEVKFNIFKRINTGGLPLSAQEIRHALNQGPATDLLSRLAESREFKIATSYGIRDNRMGDRECVLRSLAFIITPYPEYNTADLDGFLNRTMSNLNQMPMAQHAKLTTQFLQAMSLAYQLFGDQAFRKRFRRASYRYPINKALFEAWSVSLAGLSAHEAAQLLSKKEQLIEGFLDLMEDYNFDNAVSVGTGDIRKVRLRFSRVEHLVRSQLK